MSMGSSLFRLYVIEEMNGTQEGRGPVGARHAPPVTPTWLEVAEGVSYLSAPPGQPPVLSTEAPRGGDAYLLVEPVQLRYGPRLVLVSLDGLVPLVNGRPAPDVAVLGEEDELGFAEGDCALHVRLCRRVSIGPVPAAFVGKRCRLCRSPFEPGQRAYLCYNCRVPMHLEGEDVPAAERLRCASEAPTCPSCHVAVVLEGAPSFTPELP